VIVCDVSRDGEVGSLGDIDNKLPSETSLDICEVIDVSVST